MAQFDIPSDRLADPDVWPDCCARCGAAGTTLVPMPKRWTKRISGVRVPFCDRHRSDFAVRGRRTRIGFAIVLTGMAVTAAATWVLHPHLGGRNAGNEASRLMSTLMFGLGSAFPIGLLTMIWAKAPVRVVQVVGRLATVAGVCGAFRQAVTDGPPPSALPEVPDDATFEASLYRPTPTTPAGTGGLLFGAALVAGAFFGVLTAVAGQELSPDALGWDPSGWWYVLASAGPAAVIGWTGMGPATLFHRVGLLAAAGLAVSFTAMVAVVKLITFSPYLWFAAAYSFAPLVVLQTLVLQPIIWHGRVRHGWLAGVCGAVTPLLYAGAVYLVAGLESGPQSAALILGPIAALLMWETNASTARTPHCHRCDAWLVKRRIGSFRLPRAAVEPALAGGRLVSLAGEMPHPAAAAIGDVELECHSCPTCEDRGTVVLELSDCVKGGKHGTTPTLKRVDRYLYPGAAMLVVDRMFPPPDEPKKAEEGE